MSKNIKAAIITAGIVGVFVIIFILAIEYPYWALCVIISVIFIVIFSVIKNYLK